MSYVCGCCGKVHAELSRYTMWQIPELTEDEEDQLEFDGKHIARAGARCFVRCEVEVPFPEPSEKPMGFICWAEVSVLDYTRYVAYRGRKKERGGFREWVEGKLANPVPAVPDSLGTKVRFEVVKGDPMPYVKWVEPNSSLARRISEGANPEFWHEALGLSITGVEG